jgi:hypothetical protein
LLDKQIIEKASDILSHLGPYTALEGKYPLVECATFGDEIKGKGWNDQSNLHFVDSPFFDEGYKSEEEPSFYNATWAIVTILYYIIKNRT